MLYIDRYGVSFMDDNRGAEVHEKIALAIFSSMSSDEKVEILQYIEGIDYV